MTSAANGKIYAIGGEGGSATVEEYDPLTDIWISQTSTSSAHNRGGVAGPSNGKVYAIGGREGSQHIIEEGSPPVHQVSIDIKPGSYPNSVNLGSRGTIPVAIFSSSAFDARTVDPLSVSLASAPVKLKGKAPPWLPLTTSTAMVV